MTGFHTRHTSTTRARNDSSSRLPKMELSRLKQLRELSERELAASIIVNEDYSERDATDACRGQALDPQGQRRRDLPGFGPALVARSSVRVILQFAMKC